MVHKKKYGLLAAALLIVCCIWIYIKMNEASGELHGEITAAEETEGAEEGAANPCAGSYDLPLDRQEKEEAEEDCKKMLELLLDIYENADKGEATNVVLSDKTVLEMQDKMMETGCPVSTGVPYSNMENYESVDSFLEKCRNKKSGSVIIYNIHYDGGVGRKKLIFDGIDMYVLNARGVWSDGKKTGMVYISYNRVKEWSYTEKGWFCYELCLPNTPETSRVIDASCLIRIKPMTEEQREMSKRCVSGLGYQGNNILCSDWDADHMDKLDYNGVYEYLYGMKYQERFHLGDDKNGIPKEEFENLIMEYFPVTVEQIQEYAVFDEESRTYAWGWLDFSNYVPTSFGLSRPEVTDIKENEDGTVTLTVEAVCDVVVYDGAVITHELTVRFAEDGSFQYLGNKILSDGREGVPEYQYRIDRNEKEY